MTTATNQPIDPLSIAMRLVGELNSNREAFTLLRDTLIGAELRQAPARLDALESTVQQLVELLRELLDSLPEAMGNATVPLAAAIDNLQTDLTNVGRIQQAILPQLENIRVFQQTTQVEVDAIRESQRTMQSTIGNLDNSVAEIKGWGLELLSPRRISRYADVIRMTALREVPQCEIRSIAENAFREGNITADEMSRVSNADAYYHGRSSLQDADAYLVVQVSYTVNSNDVTRALDQADILARITGESAIPVVAGAYLRPDGAAAANGPVRVHYVPIGDGNSLRA